MGIHVEFKIGVSCSSSFVDRCFVFRIERTNTVLLTLKTFNDYTKNLAHIVGCVDDFVFFNALCRFLIGLILISTIVCHE